MASDLSTLPVSGIRVAACGDMHVSNFGVYATAERSENDPLFLQLKEASASVLAPYVDLKLPFKHQGHRVVFGQRLTQGSPDIFLGWGG